MKNFYISAFILVFSLMLYSCQTTHVLYNSNINIELNKIGITYLNKENPKIEIIFPFINSVFKKSALDFSHQYLKTDAIDLPDTINIFKPDSNLIKEICLRNKLDAIIISYIEFTHITKNYYYNFIPVGSSQYFDHILYIKLFDKNSKLIYYIIHDTDKDVYWHVPSNEVLIANSIEDICKKMGNLRSDIIR